MTTPGNPETTPSDSIFSREELEQMLVDMDRISSAFYAAATRQHCHAFIEFTGLMNEFILICRATLTAGKDFTLCNTHSGESLEMADHQVRYLTEKLDCIYGPTISNDPTLSRVFLEGMGFGKLLTEHAAMKARLERLDR